MDLVRRARERDVNQQRRPGNRGGRRLVLYELVSSGGVAIVYGGAYGTVILRAASNMSARAER